MKINPFFSTISKSIVSNKTYSSSIIVAIAAVICAMMTMTSCSGPAYLGSHHTYVDRPMTTDKNSVAIQATAKINRAHSYALENADNRSAEVGLHAAKQYQGGYVQGGIFGFAGNVKKVTIPNETISEFNPSFEGPMRGVGVRLGGGKTIAIDQKRELSFGAYTEIFNETNKIEDSFNPKTNIPASYFIPTVGITTEYRQKIKRGHFGVEAALGYSSILGALGGTYVHGTAFVTQGPVNVFVQSSYSPLFSKAPITTLGVGFNLSEGFGKEN